MNHDMQSNNGMVSRDHHDVMDELKLEKNEPISEVLET
jgi:hypothetical protein